MKLQKIPAGFLVFVGGGLGASLRWILTASFPDSTIATWVINSVGAAGLGFLLTLLPLWGSEDSSPAGATRRTLRLGVGTGLLGGFTTYSTFSVQAITLLQDERWGGFLLYALGTLTVGCAACWLGVLLAEKLGSHFMQPSLKGDSA